MFQAGNLTSGLPVANIAAHAAIGCASSVASGGKCGPGALSAGVGSFSGQVLPDLGFEGNLVARATVGGLSSVAGGGKFGNGAATAAFGYLYNEFAHNDEERGYAPTGYEGGLVCGGPEGNSCVVTGIHEYWGFEKAIVGSIALGRAAISIYDQLVKYLDYLSWANAKPSDEPGTASLYHQGNLSNGVNGNQSISLSPSSELGHYRPGGSLYKFDVPRNLLNEWESNGYLVPGFDLHEPTGIRTPEVRVYPPVSGQLNRFLVR